MTDIDPAARGEVPSPPRLSEDPLHILDSPEAGGRVIRGGALMTVSYAAGVALGIASASLMTRHLGVDRFGKYIVVTSLVAIVGGLSEAGLSNIAAREYATLGRDERNRLMANLLGIRVAIVLLGIVVATAFALAAGYDHVMVVGTLLAGLGLLLATVQQTYSVPLGVSLRFVWITGLDLLRQVLFVALVVGLVASGAGLLPFLGAPVPVGVVVLVVAAAAVRKFVPLLPSFDAAEWRRILGLTAAFAAASAVGTIYVYTAIVGTSLVGSGRDSGFLGASFRIFTVLTTVSLLLVSSAFPVLARAAANDFARLQYATQRMFEIALIIGGFMALLTVIGAPLAIAVVAGPKYDPAVSILRIHGVVVAVNFLALTWGFALVSMRRHRVLLVGNAGALLLCVALTLALVPFLGARGAALAMLAGDTVLAVFYSVVLFVRGELELEVRVLLWVAVAAAAGAAVMLIPHLTVAFELAAAAAIYLAVLFVSRAIPREVFDALGLARRGGAT